jgi:hypothetical protein
MLFGVFGTPGAGFFRAFAERTELKSESEQAR